MKKFLVFIFLLILSFSVLNAITITSYTFDKSSYSPGDSGELKLEISLSHAISSTETLLGFRNVIVEINSDFATQKSFYLGDSTQNTLYLSIPLKIGSDVSPGVYAIPVKVSGYADISSSGSTKSELDISRTTAVIKVVKQPKFSAYIKPQLLSEKEEVTVGICNNGGKAKDVEISVAGDFLFSEGSLFFGDIGEGLCVEKVASIETFSEGKSTLSITINYKDALGQDGEKTVSIPVTVDRGSTTLILSHKNSIQSGKESNITLELTNKGKDAEDIRIRPSSDLNLVGKSEILVSSLSEDSSISINSKVYTELPPGVHIVPFVVVWKEEGEEQTETLNVPIKIVASDGIEVYLEAEPLPLEQGKEATLSVVVANKANFDLSSISVSIQSDAFDILEITNKKFIGSLQPDDFSSEQFKIMLKDSGEKNVSVVVEYKDPSGDIKKEELEIPIKINSRKVDSLPILYLVIPLILVIGFLYYFFKLRKGVK